mmetsp:Transcript_74266/g.187757  ORF Transcript_74266/g.187757 Transcript_74266/m.187757 type:complete len:281 (+) Transcript_74266:105-947(+)
MVTRRQCAQPSLRRKIQFAARRGHDVVDLCRDCEVDEGVHLHDVVFLWQASELLDQMHRGVGTNRHPEHVGNGLQAIRRHSRCILAHRPSVGDHNHQALGRFAAVFQHLLGLRQRNGSRGRGRRPFQARHRLGHTSSVVGKLLDPSDSAIRLEVDLNTGIGTVALLQSFPGARPAEQYQSRLDQVIAALEAVDEYLCEVLGQLPAIGAERTAAVEEDDDVDLLLALEKKVGIRHHRPAGPCAAPLEVHPLPTPIPWTTASARRCLGDFAVTACVAPIARL